MGLPQAGPLNSLLLSFLHDPALPAAVPAVLIVRRAFLWSGARLHPKAVLLSLWRGSLAGLNPGFGWNDILVGASGQEDGRLSCILSLR